MAVNSSERKAAREKHGDDHGMGCRGREEARSREKSGTDERVDDQDIAEPEPSDERRRGCFHEDCSRRGGECDRAGLKGRQAEAQLQHQRKRKGTAPTPMRKKEAPITPARKVGMRSRSKSMTGFLARRACHIEGAYRKAGCRQKEAEPERACVLAQHRQPEHESRETQTREREAGLVERRRVRLHDVGDELPGQDKAERADGHIHIEIQRQLK